MPGSIKKMFIGLLNVCILVSFSGSLVSNCQEPIQRVPLKNWLYQAREVLFNKNSNETLFHSFIASVNKCGGNCNTTNDPNARACVPNKVKNMKVKVYNLMSGVNETKFLVQHQSRERKCWLNESVCHLKQKWNHNEYPCECREFVNWGSCKNYYMWNLSMNDCECNKTCKIDKYLDIKSCSCKNCLFGN